MIAEELGVYLIDGTPGRDVGYENTDFQYFIALAASCVQDGIKIGEYLFRLLYNGSIVQFCASSCNGQDTGYIDEPIMNNGL